MAAALAMVNVIFVTGISLAILSPEDRAKLVDLLKCHSSNGVTIVVDTNYRPRLWPSADNGFVALVECDPAKSGHPSSADRLKPEQAYRTGRVAHLKRDVFDQIFNVPIDAKVPSVFVEPGVIEKLQAMVRQ